MVCWMRALTTATKPGATALEMTGAAMGDLLATFVATVPALVRTTSTGLATSDYAQIPDASGVRQDCHRWWLLMG